MTYSSNPSAYTAKAIERAARQWQELRRELRTIEKDVNAGAGLLSFARDRMEESHEWLLRHGMDISDPHNVQVVPVPVERHPKNKVESREWELGIASASESFLQNFAVA